MTMTLVSKSILGQQGSFDGSDVVDIVLQKTTGQAVSGYQTAQVLRHTSAKRTVDRRG